MDITVIYAVLKDREHKPIMRNRLQTIMQEMLSTENGFEEHDDEGQWYKSIYYTGNVSHGCLTQKTCNIRIDYLPTRNEGEIYVTQTDINERQ